VSLTCNALLLIPTNPAVISPWDFVMQPFGSCFQRTVTLCDTNSKSLPASPSVPNNSVSLRGPQPFWDQISSNVPPWKAKSDETKSLYLGSGVLCSLLAFGTEFLALLALKSLGVGLL
jgi:hypothetical protein